MSNLKKAIVMAFPGYEELYKIAKPSVEFFAKKHNYDLLTYTDNPTNLPASWSKVPRLIDALESGYDSVLWLDADVVIVDPTEDIVVPAQMHQALAQHTTPDNLKTVNCGVWYLRKQALEFLREVWKLGPVPSANPEWWEQNAVMQVLGISTFPPYATPASSNKYLQHLFDLDYSWNVAVFDKRGFNTKSNFRILHAAGCGSIARRADIMRRWIHQLSVDRFQ